MSKVSVLIIGAGNIADKHLESLSNINSFKLNGIYSRTLSKAKILSSKYCIENLYKNFKDIKKSIEKIDIIFILVSPEETYSVFRKIKNFKKMIFFEKPVGVNLKQNKLILDEIERLKIKSFVGLNRRYYSVINKGLTKLTSNNKKIINIIIEGHERIWIVKKVIKNYSNLKYWPFLNSLHHVDLIRYLGGEVNYKTFYKIQNKNSHSILLKTYKNISISYISNYDYFDGWSVKIYNDKGEYLNIKPLEKCYWISHHSNKEIKPRKSDVLFKPGFSEMHKNLINYFKTNKKQWPNQDVKDAFKSSLLVNKIFYEN